MRINGFSGTNTQAGTMGMTQGNDPVSKNIQNQIANAHWHVPVSVLPYFPAPLPVSWKNLHRASPAYLPVTIR